MEFHFDFIGMFMHITVHDVDCGEEQIYQANAHSVKPKCLIQK